MRVIPPLALTGRWCIPEAALVSSTLAEPGPGETAWVTGTTYAVGDVRIRTQTHRKYERRVAGAGAVVPELDPDNWRDIGPTNKWAMFDTYRSSQSVGGLSETIVINPGKRIDSIGLVGLAASSATLTQSIGATVYFSRVINLLGRLTRTATDYCFGEFRLNPNAVLFDLPLIAGATITITLTGSAVKCGAVFIGRSIYLGNVLRGASNDGLNFSKIERDAFGDIAVLTPRRTVPKTDLTLAIKATMVDQLLQVRDDLNAVPALYSGLDDQVDLPYFKSLLFVGVYKQFLLSLDYVNDASLRLVVEEI